MLNLIKHLLKIDENFLILFSKSFIIGLFALLVEKSETISLVLVSPSQEIALNVVFIFSLRIFLKYDEDKFASVKTKPKCCCHIWINHS